MINNYLKTPSVIKDNPINNSKIYSNNIDGFTFEYPNSYKIEETIQEGNTLLHLKRDEMLDIQGYDLLKGASIRITYKKNIESFYDYVKQENKTALDKNMNIKIEEKKINNIEALEINFGNNYPLAFIGIRSVYLRNNDDVLGLSFMMGIQSLETEYENYVKDFDSILNSVKFLE